VEPEHEFVLKSGKPLKNLRDLMRELIEMDEETFQHHVNDSKNDFAIWINDILEHQKIADEIRNKKARNELLDILQKHDEEIRKEIEKTKLGEATEEVGSIKQKLEHERIRIDGMKNKYESRLKSLEKIRKAIEEEKEKADNEKSDFEKERTEFQRIKTETEKEKSDLKDQKEKLNKEKLEVEKESKQLKKEKVEVKKIFSKKEIEEKELIEEKKGVDTLKGIIDEREKELNIREESLDKLERDLKNREIEIEKDLKILEVRMSKENEVAVSYKQQKEELEKQLDTMRKKLETERKFDRHIGKVEKQIEDKKDKVREGGFEVYLDQKLHEMKQGSLESTEQNLPPLHERTNPHIYKLIEECRMLMEQGDLDKAREKYHKLKKDYEKSNFQGHEKSSVYYAIREIYDDIHLAMLRE